MAAIPPNAERWFPLLETNPPTYNRFRSERIGERDITIYLLEDFSDPTIDRAVNCMRQFLASDRQFCPVFPLDPPDELRAWISRKQFVIINGLAVCLSKGRHFDAPRGEYKDRYFSTGLLKQPVRCVQGHLLERRSAQLWANVKGNTCPVPPEHPIGNLEVDPELAHDIAIFRRETRTEQAERQRESEYREIQDLRIQMQQMQLDRLNNSLLPGTTPLIRAGAKIGLKVCGKGACKLLIKTTSREGLKRGAQAVAKKIPVASFIIGVAAGVYRVSQGQLWRASGEILSGTLALAPGVGTAASVMVDLIIAAEDVYDMNPQEQPNAAEDLQAAYGLLGIDMVQNPDPTHAVVDAAFRHQMLLVHEDKLRPHGDAFMAMGAPLATVLNNARDYIYQQRGWNH